MSYRPLGAARILRRNLLIYGLGGLVVPFAGIKAIDLLLVALEAGLKEIAVRDHVLVSVRLLVVFTLLLGFGYPAVVWAIGRVALCAPRADRSSPATGRSSAPSLIGQAVSSSGLFRPRLLGRRQRLRRRRLGGSELRADVEGARRVAAEVADALAENPGAKGPVPADAVTASASGLDPHVSPAFALWQVPRVSKETGLPAAELEAALVARRTEGRFLGLFGEPRVNVLLLNLDVQARGRGAATGPP